MQRGIQAIASAAMRLSIKVNDLAAYVFTIAASGAGRKFRNMLRLYCLKYPVKCIMAGDDDHSGSSFQPGFMGLRKKLHSGETFAASQKSA